MSKGNKSNEEAMASPDLKQAKRHPAFGALKGTVFVPPGVDLTEPADPDWADLIARRWPQRSHER